MQRESQRTLEVDVPTGGREIRAAVQIYTSEVWGTASSTKTCPICPNTKQKKASSTFSSWTGTFTWTYVDRAIKLYLSPPMAATPRPDLASPSGYTVHLVLGLLPGIWLAWVGSRHGWWLLRESLTSLVVSATGNCPEEQSQRPPEEVSSCDWSFMHHYSLPKPPNRFPILNDTSLYNWM